MKTHMFLIASLVLAAATAGAADSKPAGTIDSKAAFAKLKTLAGTWEGESGMGKVRAVYEVIAGGTALVERDSGEKMPPMVTVYHLDGDRLMLTHYCVAGNQPRMQAGSYNPETGELRFQFLDATNLPSGAGHMHNATIRFLDADQLHAAWEFHENGQLKSTETLRYTRVQ